MAVRCSVNQPALQTLDDVQLQEPRAQVTGLASRIGDNRCQCHAAAARHTICIWGLCNAKVAICIIAIDTLSRQWLLQAVQCRRWHHVRCKTSRNAADVRVSRSFGDGMSPAIFHLRLHRADSEASRSRATHFLGTMRAKTHKRTRRQVSYGTCASRR